MYVFYYFYGSFQEYVNLLTKMKLCNFYLTYIESQGYTLTRHTRTKVQVAFVSNVILDLSKLVLQKVKPKGPSASRHFTWSYKNILHQPPTKCHPPSGLMVCSLTSNLFRPRLWPSLTTCRQSILSSANLQFNQVNPMLRYIFKYCFCFHIPICVKIRQFYKCTRLRMDQQLMKLQD